MKVWKVADVSEVCFSGYDWEEFDDMPKAMEHASELIENYGAERVSVVPPWGDINGGESIEVDARGIHWENADG